MTVLLLAGCAGQEPPLAARIAGALPAAVVHATGETEAVATTNADAADDPAIWRNPADPAASLIVGTDKKAGLHVYDLTVGCATSSMRGRQQCRPGGRWRADPRRGERPQRPANAHVALFTLDPATAKLTPLGASRRARARPMASASTGRRRRSMPSWWPRTARSARSRSTCRARSHGRRSSGR